MTRLPNVLLIHTKPHRADHLGWAGHPVPPAPNVDATAHQAARFERFSSACPSRLAAAEKG